MASSHTHTLRELGTLAQDLSRIEQGIMPAQSDTQSEAPPSSFRSFVSYDSTDSLFMNSPTSPQLKMFLSRGNKEVLRIVNDLSLSHRRTNAPVSSMMQGATPEDSTGTDTTTTTTAVQRILSFQSSSSSSSQQQDEQPESSSIPRLPKISAVTKNEKRSISRLPKPNKHDLHVLGQLNKQFINNNELDMDSSLYKKLKATRRVGGSQKLVSDEDQSQHHSHRKSSSRHTRRRSSSEMNLQEQHSHEHIDSTQLEVVAKDNAADNADNAEEETTNFFDKLSPKRNEGKKSPVTKLKQELQHSFGVRQQITDVIDDQMRRDRLDLPLSFIQSIENKSTRNQFLKERATVAILFMLRRVLSRRKAQYLKRWRHWNMYFNQDRILHAANEIIRIARGKLGRLEAEERIIQREIQREQEVQRQAELKEVRHFAAINIQRLMRGWYARDFAEIAKTHRDNATCIQCFVRYTFANRRVHQIRTKKHLLFASSSRIQRSYRCYKARVLYGLKRRIRRAERSVQYAKEKTEKVRLKFEAKGAANLISRWWRMINIRKQFLRYRKLNKGRRVLKIQCSYRCYVSRVELTRRKEEHASWLESRDSAASLVQALYRRNKDKERVAAMRAIIAAADGERKKRIESAREDRVKTFRFVGEVNLTKVHRRLFDFRKAVDPFKKSRETNAVLKLQAYYRGNKARRRLKTQRMNHHLFLRRKKKTTREAATLKLQTRWRSKVLRRKFLTEKRDKCAVLIQKTWRAYQGRSTAMSFLQYTFSSRNIQRVWRGYIGREYVKKRKEEFDRLGSKATGIQCIARRYLARATVERIKARRRYLEEVGLMGKEEFRICRAHLRDEMMLSSFRSNSTRKNSIDKKGIGYILFETLCSGGRKSLHDDDKKELRVGNTTLSRMCNDSHIIDDKRVKRNTVGILFAKAKEKNNDKLNFYEFHEFLRQLAITRYPKVEELRQMTNGDAQILTMLCEHVLGGTYPKLHRRQLRTKMFRKMAKTLDKIIDTKLDYLATKMQAAIRGVQTRHAFVKLMMDHDKLVERQRLERAAQLIEAHIRKIFARAGAEKLASKTIQKFVDPISKEAYYYNPKTGVTSWDKPDILGNQDVLDPQVLPDKNVGLLFFIFFFLLSCSCFIIKVL
jgi:hypothetical protein